MTPVLDLRNVFYYPRFELILNADGSPVPESDPYRLFQPKKQPHLDAAPRASLPGTHAIIRSLPRSYYHQLVEYIPRLLSLPATVEPLHLLYTCSLTPVEQYFFPFLLPEHVTPQTISKHVLYHVERLLLPTLPSNNTAGDIPRVYIETLRRNAPAQPPKKQHRIYITRASQAHRHRRHIKNEKELIAALSPHGFQTVALETISIPEAIEMFYDAEIIVGAHGAGLTNMIFSNNANIIELHPLPQGEDHFKTLASICGHNFSQLRGAESYIHCNFFIDIEACVRLVKEAISNNATANPAKQVAAL